MPTLSEAKTANASTKFSSTPVAIFVGGTSGIGQGAVEAFARYTEGNAHIIIVGRNEENARKIIDSFPEHASSKYEFLQCDISRLANVSVAVKDIKEKYGLTKLNYLLMSPGFVTVFGCFDDAGEGIDRKMAVHYYSRFKLVNGLLPLLESAKAAGEEARVVSVLGAGHGGKPDLNDVGLKNTYSVAKCGYQTPTFTSLTVEELGKRYPNISFTHIHPGMVDNPYRKSNMDYSYDCSIRCSFCCVSPDLR